MLGLFLFSLVVSGSFLALAWFAAGRRYPAVAVCSAAVVGTFAGLCLNSVVLSLQGLATFGLAVLFGIAGSPTRAHRGAVVGAMLLTYVIVLGNASSRWREVVQAQQAHPVQSVSARLAYDTAIDRLDRR